MRQISRVTCVAALFLVFRFCRSNIHVFFILSCVFIGIEYCSCKHCHCIDGNFFVVDVIDVRRYIILASFYTCNITNVIFTTNDRFFLNFCLSFYSFVFASRGSMCVYVWVFFWKREVGGWLQTLVTNSYTTGCPQT